jgi:hypothetical protein
MTIERTILREHDAGCWLDSHRGHYINRDMILLAVELGFIIDPFVRYALLHYDDDMTDENFPVEGMYDVAEFALDWLNIGENTGRDRPIPGQNNPPAIPEGYAWAWNDGDFGLYKIEDMED